MEVVMDLDNIVTQDELDEPAPMDQVEDRVGEGLQDDELTRAGELLRQEGERELEAAKDSA